MPQIIGWAGLGGPSEITQPSPCHGQGHQGTSTDIPLVLDLPRLDETQ